MTNLQRDNAELIACPACRQPLVPRVNGRPDDLVKCDCTVVSLEWLRLALESLSPQPPAETGDDAIELFEATPEQIERANAAVAVNMLDEGTPRYQSAQGYACALTAIMQTDAAIASRLSVSTGDLDDRFAAVTERAVTKFREGLAAPETGDDELVAGAGLLRRVAGQIRSYSNMRDAAELDLLANRLEALSRKGRE